MLFVPPVFARRAADAMRGSGVKVGSVVSYPHGLSKPTIKAIEATNLAKDGIDAVEITPLAANVRAANVRAANVRAAQSNALRVELLEIVRGARAAKPSVAIHVRLDLDLLGLDEEAVASAGRLIAQGACDGITLAANDVRTTQAALATLVALELPLELKAMAASDDDASALMSAGRSLIIGRS
jgi:hypothetical protein